MSLRKHSERNQSVLAALVAHIAKIIIENQHQCARGVFSGGSSSVAYISMRNGARKSGITICRAISSAGGDAAATAAGVCRALLAACYRMLEETPSLKRRNKHESARLHNEMAYLCASRNEKKACAWRRARHARITRRGKTTLARRGISHASHTRCGRRARAAIAQHLCVAASAALARSEESEEEER